MKATPTIQVDNELTRITEWRFAPGGVHHGELVAGQSYFRGAGVEHDVKNVNDHEFTFVEIEFKSTGA